MKNDGPTISQAEGPGQEAALGTVAELCARYDITALNGFLSSCRAFAADKLLNVAVLGRFKAGKSSFLNALAGEPVLPAGVTPITAAVTEIRYGPSARADVTFEDMRTTRIPVERISEFISEAENPANQKSVARVQVELPSMSRYRGIRFVDTPGLDSVFEHNTNASIQWLPNVGLALVAVGVDPPLTQHDLELIRTLQRYTPRVALLLTKVDTLEPGERRQVQDFVATQLAQHFDQPVPLFPFSVRAGFEDLRNGIDGELLEKIQSNAAAQRSSILRHKLDSLLDECAGYLRLALRAAEVSGAERDQLHSKIFGGGSLPADTRLGLQLVVRHAMEASRARFEALLAPEEGPARNRLLAELETEFPGWTRSLRVALERFEAWLRASLHQEIAGLSQKHQEEFAEPVHQVSKRLAESLQDFRNRLSERALETLGVPLRTTESDFPVEAPRNPDIYVGKVFDRNWELLSPVLPIALVKGAVKRHFRRKTADAVFVNSSRLVSQWEEVVNRSLLAARRQAGKRLDELIATIERLLAAAQEQVPQIRADLERLTSLRDEMRAAEGRPEAP